jgi:hypothetical protein
MYFREPQPLDKWLVRSLLLLSEKNCVVAMAILSKRLIDFKNDDYFLSIQISELPFRRRVSTLLLSAGLNTVKDIIEYNVDKLDNIPGMGGVWRGNVMEVLERVIERKDNIKGLVGLDLRAALEDRYRFEETDKAEE